MNELYEGKNYLKIFVSLKNIFKIGNKSNILIFPPPLDSTAL